MQDRQASRLDRLRKCFAVAMAAACLAGASGVMAAGLVPETTPEARGAQVERYFELPGDCLDEVFFEPLVVNGEALDIGIYLEKRHLKLNASEDGEDVAVEGGVVPFVFDHPEWTEGIETSCGWGVKATPSPDPCSLREDCRSRLVLRRSAVDEKLFPIWSVTQRRELSRDEISRILPDVGPTFRVGTEGWIHSLLDSGTEQSSDTRVLISKSDETLRDPQAVAPVAVWDAGGLRWGHKPLLYLEESLCRRSEGAAGRLKIGSGEHDVHLRNDHFKVTGVEDPETPVMRSYAEGDLWIFDSLEEPWGEHRIAANVYAYAIQTLEMYQRLSPWLPCRINGLTIKQVIGADAKSCSAFWLGRGEITLPLLCRKWGEFVPKGLCPEVVAHELTHELLSTLLDETTGGRKFDLEDRVLWEGLADYMAVSAIRQGVYGAHCGSDLRSVKDSLYSPELWPTISMLDLDSSTDSSRRSLVVSGALWNLANRLSQSKMVENNLSLSAADEQDRDRLLVGRLALLAVLLGGSDLPSFASVFERVARDTLEPVDQDAVCETLWDRSHVFVRGCRHRTKTPMFEIKQAEYGDRVVVSGSFFGTSNCPGYSLEVFFEEGGKKSFGPVPTNRALTIEEANLGEVILQPGQTPAFVKLTARCARPVELSASIAITSRPKKEIQLAERVREMKISSYSLAESRRSVWIGVRDLAQNLRLFEVTPRFDVLPWAQATRTISPGFSMHGSTVQAFTPGDRKGIELDLKRSRIKVFEFKGSRVEGLTSDVDPLFSVEMEGSSLKASRWDPVASEFLIDTLPFEETGTPRAFAPRFIGGAPGVEVQEGDSAAYVWHQLAPSRAESDHPETQIVKVFADPPRLLITDESGNTEEVVAFPDSPCRSQPYWERSTSGAMAAMTCDAQVKLRRQPGQKWSATATRLGPAFPAADKPLHFANVDGTPGDELIVGPLVRNDGGGAVYEIRALGMSDEPVGGRWPIRSRRRPAVPLAFADIDGDRCDEVIMASESVQVFDPNEGLPSCEAASQ